jgi:hypothetical protein
MSIPNIFNYLIIFNKWEGEKNLGEEESENKFHSWVPQA